VEHGVIQDRLFLPGFAKLLFSKQARFAGRVNTTTARTANFTASGTTLYHLSNNRHEQRTSQHGRVLFPLTLRETGTAFSQR
jgi:hypothetical protein